MNNITNVNKNIDNVKNKNNPQNKNIKVNENQNINEKNLNRDTVFESFKIKYDFELIKLKYELLETNEHLNYGLIVNSSYLKIANRKLDYLENYIESLKNTIVNLSNPYNLNFWRKISNIILKNLFIILKNKDYTLNQNKDESIYENLKSIVDKMKNPSNKIKKKLSDYKSYLKNLKNKKGTLIGNLSPAADKKRKYNLITIYKKEKADIKASLSVDFLFFLKEKGNKINHFDENVLNYILFNNLNIVEEQKKESKKEKVGEKENIEIEHKNVNEKSKIDESENIEGKIDKIQIGDTITKKPNNAIIKKNVYQIKEKKSKSIESKNARIKSVEEIKSNEFENTEKIINKNKINKTKSKSSILKHKISKNTKLIINEKIPLVEPKNAEKIIIKNITENKKIKEPKNTIIIIDEKNNIKAEPTELNVNEFKEKINGNKTEKNKINKKREGEGKDIEEKVYEIKLENININKEYERKKILTGSELIEILKNPLKFQQKNINKISLFDSVYKNIDDFKKDIGYNDEKKIIDSENKTKELDYKIKELIKQIEKNFEKNQIDIKQIKKVQFIDSNLTDQINIYFELKKLEVENNKKKLFVKIIT